MRYGLGRLRLPIPAIPVVLAWLAIALFTSVDLQVGVRDYYPVPAFDYAVRSEFIHSIGVTGVPPANPFFFPGRAVPIRYHYFWLLLPSLVCQATGHAIGPRAAWIGSVFWAGLGLVCLVSVALRVFWNRGPAAFPRRAVAGTLLLGVTGLDIIPTALLWLLRAKGMASAVLPSIEWWNEQVDGFISTAVWEAHYLAGLIACLTAFLLLQEGSRQIVLARRVVYSVLAGLALATAVGAAIYIVFVFGIFLISWMALAAGKRWWPQAFVLVIAGTVAAALSSPYLLSVLPPGGGASGTPSAGGPPLQLWMRPFHPVVWLGKGLGFGPWALMLANALLLPLNYFLELGFFFAAGILWWRRRKAEEAALSESEWALAVLVVTSMTVCTFLRSSVIANNDLGWRGFLLAQFGLLLWSVDVICGQSRKSLLTVLLVLGAAGTAYELVILRLYPVLADAGVTQSTPWMGPPDRQFGLRNYAAREAYEWIAHSTAPDAVLQFEPSLASQDTSALLYADRQLAAADGSCLAVFGGDRSLCPPLVARLADLYPRNGGAAAASLDAACHALPVDILVAKDIDAVWADSRSWVWNEKPIFANDRFRVFRCREGRQPAIQKRAR